MRTRLLMAVIASVLVYGCFGLAAVASALEAFRALPPAQQRALPTMTLPDHQGAAFNWDELRGKVVVVRFWATW